jgi:hypothetical protein
VVTLLDSVPPKGQEPWYIKMIALIICLVIFGAFLLPLLIFIGQQLWSLV